MFNLKSLAVLATSLILSGCSNWLVIEDLEIEYVAEAEISGQSGLQLLLGDLGFDGLSEFDITSSNRFNQEIGDISRVEAMHLDRFELSAKDNSQSIDFFSSIQFYVAQGDETGELLAWSDNFPQDSNKVVLNVNKSLDLAPYLKSGEMTIRTEADGDQPENDTVIVAELLFLVDARIIE